MAGSGTTLFDRSGGINGTIVGATWNNANYLSFVGGHGAVGGNYNRVDFGLPVSMCKAWNDSFSICLGFKSSKNDANDHQLFGVMDGGLSATWININIQANNTILLQLVNAASIKTANPAGSVCDGKWKCIILTYKTNSMICYLNGVALANSTDQAFTSGNFFAATCKAALGARWQNANLNYSNDATVDICLFKFFNIALSAGQVANETNEYFNIF